MCACFCLCCRQEHAYIMSVFLLNIAYIIIFKVLVKAEYYSVDITVSLSKEDNDTRLQN